MSLVGDAPWPAAPVDLGQIGGCPVLHCGMPGGRCAIRVPQSLGLRAYAYLRWAAAQRLCPPLGGVVRDRRREWVYFLTPTPQDWERRRVATSVSRVPQARMLAEGTMVVLPMMGGRRNRWLNYSPHPTDTWSVLAALRVATRAAQDGITLRAAATHEDLRALVRAIQAFR